jgi:Lon protease-like protein
MTYPPDQPSHPLTTDLPLFPLHSVLCPGVALPLHIFEERYRRMVRRCLERREPFGVVLLQGGQEAGPLHGRIARVGTTALIRQAGRYPDGRLDIVTVGDRRFRVESLDRTSEPYLVGRVHLLEEPVGPETEARELASRAGSRFMRYLELLQPELPADGPEIEVEIEIELEDELGEESPDPAESSGLITFVREDMPEDLGVDLGSGGESLESPGMSREVGAHELDTSGIDDRERRELLMAAARRLVGTGDPTALSYVLTALIQIDVPSRQDLLEAPDTVTRLQRLETILGREIGLLGRHLRPLVIEPGQANLRRN